MLDLVEHGVSVLADVCEQREVDVRLVVDVGCGPGVATSVLAQRFERARVVAVDSSPTMLDHASARAVRLAVGERVETRLVDLPDGLDALERADVAWASMVLHHVHDASAALRLLHELLAPVGVLAVVEHAAAPGEPDRFAATLDGAGFALVTDEPVGSDRRLYVAQARRA